MVKKEARPRTNKDFQLIEFDLEPSTEWLIDEAAIANMQHIRTCRDQNLLAKNTPESPAILSGPAKYCRNDVKENSDRASIWSGRTLPCDGNANVIPDNASMLSGSTLAPHKTQIEHDISAVRITDSEHTKWVKQKVAEGGRGA